MTPEDPSHADPRSRQQAEALDRRLGVVRARRHVATVRAQQRRQSRAVQADQTDPGSRPPRTHDAAPASPVSRRHSSTMRLNSASTAGVRTASSRIVRLATITIRLPGPRVSTRSRLASRSTRFARFRCTALPTRRLATIPTRTSSAPSAPRTSRRVSSARKKITEKRPWRRTPCVYTASNSRRVRMVPFNSTDLRPRFDLRSRPGPEDRGGRSTAARRPERRTRGAR